MNDDEFDYQAWMRENPPDPSKIRSGIEGRNARREAFIKSREMRTERSSQMEPLAIEKPTLQLVNSKQIKAIEEWEAAYPETWLLIEVTREDFSQVYEGKLLALANDPAEFIELKKSLRQNRIVNLTTRGVPADEQATIWTKL